MRSIRNSLSIQLMTGLLFFSLIPQTIIAIIAYGSGRHSITVNVQTHLESVANLKQQAIHKWAEHLQDLTSWIIQEPHVVSNTSVITEGRTAMDAHKAAYHYLSTEFNRMVALGDVSQMFLIDKNTGKIIISSDPFWEGKFRAREPFFIHGRDGIYISDIFLSLSKGRPTMVISGPIKDPQGKVLAVLAAHANLDQLSAIMLERVDSSNTTETFLVNNSNLLITNTVFAPDGAFKKWIFGQGAQWALAGQSGVDLFLDYRNVKVIGAYLWMPDRKLALIAKQDASEAFSAIGSLEKVIVTVLLVVSLVIMISGFLFARRITDPMQKLVVGALAVGEGNLAYRVGIERKDEIGVLSLAFDQMAENLQATTISRDEKEVLLREIHHRVKNNLQMIQSMLNLQIKMIKDTNLNSLLEDSINRISSIAMIHETLYKSKDLSIVDLNSYFQDLTSYLLKSLHPSGSKISLLCRVEQIPLQLDSVIACGLIINELITNALKYAFVNKKVGQITVDLHPTDTTDAMLIVSDNGVGLAHHAGPLGEGSLGIHLVHILAEKQLEGTVKITKEPGLTYQIQFPIQT